MLGDLTKDQCFQVLHASEIGRLGCYASRKMYIVPVAYVFDGENIYIHSKEGLKVEMMRKNQDVCFQVDRIESMVNWRSVIVWGKFQELKTRSQQSIAMKFLRDRLGPLRLSEAVRPPKGFSEPGNVSKPVRAVAFRIAIKDISGKYERS